MTCVTCLLGWGGTVVWFFWGSCELEQTFRAVTSAGTSCPKSLTDLSDALWVKSSPHIPESVIAAEGGATPH